MAEHTLAPLFKEVTQRAPDLRACPLSVYRISWFGLKRSIISEFSIQRSDSYQEINSPIPLSGILNLLALCVFLHL